MVIVLALFAGEYAIRILARIHAVVYILIASVLNARLHSIVYDPRDPVTANLPSWAQREITRAPVQIATWVETRGLETFGHEVVVLAGTAGAVAIFIIVPMVTAYLLLDLEHLKSNLAAVVPEDRWRSTLALRILRSAKAS